MPVRTEIRVDYNTADSERPACDESMYVRSEPNSEHFDSTCEPLVDSSQYRLCDSQIFFASDLNIPGTPLNVSDVVIVIEAFN